MACRSFTVLALCGLLFGIGCTPARPSTAGDAAPGRGVPSRAAAAAGSVENDDAADADLAERFLKHIFRYVLAERADDLPGCVAQIQHFIAAHPAAR